MATGKKKVRGMADSNATSSVVNQSMEELMAQIEEKSASSANEEPAKEVPAAVTPTEQKPAPAQQKPQEQGEATPAKTAGKSRSKPKRLHGGDFEGADWEKFTTQLPVEIRKALRIYCASQDTKTFEKHVVADALATLLKKKGAL
ncbi:hypothetical protein [Microbulbifer sp. PSTR4-B]|uniref:hypothetical protein n=1 Tax=unclassified Microbulbifer TaxID=2619833 RepID=UPI00403A8EE5